MVITAKIKVDQEVLMAEKDISARIIRQAIMREISNEIEQNGNSLLHQRATELPPTNELLYEVKVVVMHPNEYYSIMEEEERYNNGTNNNQRINKTSHDVPKWSTYK